MFIQRRKQLSVYLENRVGELAELCKLLEKHSINIIGICAVDTIEEAVLRIVPEDEPAWQNATYLDFTHSRYGEKIGPENILQVCWDEQALYLAVRCPIPPGTTLNVPERGRDNINMFLGDGIEVFIDPGKSGTNYAHFIISALGDVYDSWMNSELQKWNISGDPDWNIGIEAGANNTESEYILEVRIPFARLSAKPPRAGERWSANFCRYLPSVQTWSPTYGGFHIPNRFGTLTFLGSPAQKSRK